MPTHCNIHNLFIFAQIKLHFMLKEDIKDNYKNRLRVVLAEKGLSNHWLAQQLGVTDMSVSRWCTNKNQPSMAQFIKISKILNIDINALLEI